MQRHVFSSYGNNYIVNDIFIAMQLFRHREGKIPQLRDLKVSVSDVRLIVLEIITENANADH